MEHKNQRLCALGDIGSTEGHRTQQNMHHANPSKVFLNLFCFVKMWCVLFLLNELQKQVFLPPIIVRIRPKGNSICAYITFRIYGIFVLTKLIYRQIHGHCIDLNGVSCFWLIQYHMWKHRSAQSQIDMTALSSNSALNERINIYCSGYIKANCD